MGSSQCGSLWRWCAGRRAPARPSVTGPRPVEKPWDSRRPAHQETTGREERRCPRAARPRRASDSSSSNRRPRRGPSRATSAPATSSRPPSVTSVTCPASAADVPAKYKGEPWARLGVDVDHDFAPLYIVPPDKKAQVAKLKALLKEADELYLATDEDREGEAIAWHLLRGRSSPRCRSSGWCSTRSPRPRSGRPSRTRASSTTTWSTPRRPAASSTGCTATRSRRCCGRRSCRSSRPAGCSRSRPGSWSSASASGWRSVPPATGTSTATLRRRTARTPPTQFAARWSRVDGTRGRPRPRLRRATGRLTRADAVLRSTRPAPARWPTGLRADRFAVRVGRATSPTRRSPVRAVHHLDAAAGGGPQAAASPRERTMRVAQKLYENGYITYMRTDSTTLSRDGDRRRPGPGRASCTATRTCPTQPRQLHEAR